MRLLDHLITQTDPRIPVRHLRPKPTHRWDACRKPHKCPEHKLTYQRVLAVKKQAEEQRRAAARRLSQVDTVRLQQAQEDLVRNPQDTDAAAVVWAITGRPS